MDLAYIFGTTSIVLYCICYFPQIHVIVKAKSSEGVSVTSILLWTQADMLSLVASVLLDLDVILIIINWYNFIIGIVMIIIVIKYQRRKSCKASVIISVCVTAVNIIVCIVVSALRHPDTVAGITIGYFTTATYILGRFPQIVENLTRKGTGEVSVSMYICTIFANICYIIVCFLDPTAIFENLPWIISTMACTILDFVILFQVWYYPKASLPN
ncbi:PQ-loop repeat-containing protein [bacterium]|nr:PQ-loop repeat-containing protein [bacterium]NDC93928.1 PQ-loop repeat-containing protein [bacterium]NDD83239.1 PQ-loop repeat-containing protein [bacterium]NDG28905.1 PQ-loop repeat-containing protein [bacterium]